MSDTQILILPAKEEDLPSILSLYAQDDMDSGVVLELREAREIFDRIKKYPNYTIFIVKAAGEVIGTFALLIMDNLAHMGARSGVVEDVVVRKDWQVKGIGRQMMQFAMNRCRARGCYKISLSSNLKRETAHLFYQATGFKKHGYSFVVNLEAPPDR